jgi:beta-lactamase superfamily II metal-dependent hydrolase
MLCCLLVALFEALFGCSPAARVQEEQKALHIYFVDTEGGAATLIVTPVGESVLIDCGNPGSRDADRIYQVAQRVGLKAIDHLIITHWHLDHFGGVGRLAQLTPIKRFYDHGIPASLAEDPVHFPILIQAYRAAAQGKRQTLEPGDELTLKQAQGSLALHLRCLCGSGKVVKDEPSAPENPGARSHVPQPDDPTDNARSLGFLLSFGGFRFLDLGDLTWNVEYKLVHPTDKIGKIDVYQSTHHGLEISNNRVLVQTVLPRVAVCNNGPRKGGHASVIATLRRVPGIEAIYQQHRNVTSAAQENTDPELIANPEEQCRGEFIHLVVAPDSKSYTLQIGPDGKARQFDTRPIRP